MTKAQFLKELRKHLGFLEEKEIDERISFYSEIIDDKIEDGKTEEEAVESIGLVEDVVIEIAQNTPINKLVKSAAKPKRKITGFEVAMLIIGFPLWFPLLITGLVLCLVFYVLTWVLVLVALAVEISFIAGFIWGIAAFVMSLKEGNIMLVYLGAALVLFSLSILFVPIIKGSAKLSVLFSKKILLSIKRKLAKKGGRNNG